MRTIRLGERNINSKGEEMIISGYTDANNIEVMFKSDNSVKKTTYAQFKAGYVLKGDNVNVSLVGEICEDVYGNECKIVEHKSDYDISVQYPNGNMINGLTLEQVVNCNFSPDMNMNFKRSTGNICLEHVGNITFERRQTFENVVAMLAMYRRCVMIRPCGFGKTQIGLKLFYSKRYNKCLFLYPTNDDTNADKVRNSHSTKKIDTKTYAWLRSRTEEQIRNLDYDIIFCDEVHCIGGDEDGTGAFRTYKAVKTLMESHPYTDFVGATATPYRMDGINVISTMFYNHICYPYTDEDAFEDGVLKVPNYYYCVYDVKKKLADEIKKSLNIEMSRDELQNTLRLSNDEINEIDARYMDQHIKRTCNKIFPNAKYMRFIAFYLTNEGENGISENKDKVIGWFKKAYPEYEVEALVITAKSGNTKKDIDDLPTEPVDPTCKGRIDVIFSCEKLCMSYHSELINGLILDRKTQSLAKYMQMVGRLLSCDDDNPIIIFDVVDNIHADFIFKQRDIELSDNEIKVIPKFEGTMTFDDVVAMYPWARNWTTITTLNKKARKSEKILNNNAKLKGEKIEYVDEATKPVHGVSEVITSEAKREIEKAWKIVEEQKMDFKQACDFLSGIEDVYGTINPCDIDREKIEEPAYNNPYIVPEIIKNKTIQTNVSEIHKIDDDKDKGTDNPNFVNINTSIELTDNEKKIEEIKQKENMDVGYNSYYYNYTTKELFSKNVKVLNKKSNFEEDIKAAIQTVNQGILDDIMRRWNSLVESSNFIENKEKYKSFDEIDRTEAKYMILKSCSEFLYSIPVEKTIMYMVEGKIVL